MVRGVEAICNLVFSMHLQSLEHLTGVTFYLTLHVVTRILSMHVTFYNLHVLREVWNKLRVVHPQTSQTPKCQGPTISSASWAPWTVSSWSPTAQWPYIAIPMPWWTFCHRKQIAPCQSGKSWLKWTNSQLSRGGHVRINHLIWGRTKEVYIILTYQLFGGSWVTFMLAMAEILGAEHGHVWKARCDLCRHWWNGHPEAGDQGRLGRLGNTPSFFFFGCGPFQHPKCKQKVRFKPFRAKMVGRRVVFFWKKSVLLILIFFLLVLKPPKETSFGPGGSRAAIDAQGIVCANWHRSAQWGVALWSSRHREDHVGQSGGEHDDSHLHSCLGSEVDVNFGGNTGSC